MDVDNKCKYCLSKHGFCVENKLDMHLVKTLTNHVLNSHCIINITMAHEHFKISYKAILGYELDRNKKEKDIFNHTIPNCVNRGSLLHYLKWTKWKLDNMKKP